MRFTVLALATGAVNAFVAPVQRKSWMKRILGPRSAIELNQGLANKGDSCDIYGSCDLYAVEEAMEEDEDQGAMIGRVSPERLAKGYDLVVLGGGPAGVAGALKAAQLGCSAIVVDVPKSPPDARGVDVLFGKDRISPHHEIISDT